MTRRILTIGDGNFSFSLALLKYLQESISSENRKEFEKNKNTVEIREKNDKHSHESAVKLVATSYDSYDEIIEKYPESERICAQLIQAKADIVHRIDATCLKESFEKQQFNIEEKFDVIIFNHPHCGEENILRHRILLSHFFQSSIEILKKDGEIRLTLASEQPEHWQALKRAAWNGLHLKTKFLDSAYEEMAVQYERRRHQNGKSFHRVLLHGEKLEQESTVLIFTLTSNSISNNSELFSQKTSSTETITKPVVHSKKRKAEQIKPFSSSTSNDLVGDAPINTSNPGLPHACPSCHKSFKTLQGVKTHIHMVHELQHCIPTKKQVCCNQCERIFESDDALLQHQTSKHGKDELIQPDWYKKEEERQEISVGSMKCPICRVQFSSQQAFQDHLKQLAPNTVLKNVCESCSKSFGDTRALRQHRLRCLIAH